MNFSRKIIKVLRENPMQAHNYLYHYSRMYIRRLTSKNIYKKNGENHLEKSIKNLYTIYKVKNKEILFNKIKQDYRNVFLPSDVNLVINYIKQDVDFSSEIIKHADLVINNKFLIMNKFYDNMYDYEKNHYKWSIDVQTGYEFKMSHYTLAQQVNNFNSVDIKRVWEIARMQYLFAPSLAYTLTKDEKYAQKVKHIINDFIDQNPVGVGPNWNVSMEVGIRVANIILAFELIRNANCVDSNFVIKFYASVYNHYLHITKNEENIGGKTYNHYLGGLLGISACNVLIPIDKKKKVSKYLFKSLKKELDRQVLEDGADFEGSLSYQRLAAELFSFTILACKNNNMEIPSEYMNKLQSLAQYTYDLMLTNGYVPQIGDNDSGRVFQLLHEDSFDHRSIIKLINGICKNQTLYPDKKDGFNLFTGILPEQNENINSNESLVLKKESSVAKISLEKMTVYTSAIDAQRFQLGSHTHNDALAFELWYENTPFILDPGTGCYTSNSSVRDMFRSIKSHSTISIDGREQKKLSKNSIFEWDSSVETSLYQKDRYTIEGFVRYERELVHFREFNFENKEVIIIKDNIKGDMEKLLCNIVLHPDIYIESLENKSVILVNGINKVKLSGSWSFTIEDWYFSPQYDVIVPCKKIIAMSKQNENELFITGISG